MDALHTAADALLPAARMPDEAQWNAVFDARDRAAAVGDAVAVAAAKVTVACQEALEDGLPGRFVQPPGYQCGSSNRLRRSLANRREVMQRVPQSIRAQAVRPVGVLAGRRLVVEQEKQRFRQDCPSRDIASEDSLQRTLGRSARVAESAASLCSVVPTRAAYRIRACRRICSGSATYPT